MLFCFVCFGEPCSDFYKYGYIHTNPIIDVNGPKLRFDLLTYSPLTSPPYFFFFFFFLHTDHTDFWLPFLRKVDNFKNEFV